MSGQLRPIRCCLCEEWIATHIAIYKGWIQPYCRICATRGAWNGVPTVVASPWMFRRCLWR